MSNCKPIRISFRKSRQSRHHLHAVSKGCFTRVGLLEKRCVVLKEYVRKDEKVCIDGVLCYPLQTYRYIRHHDKIDENQVPVGQGLLGWLMCVIRCVF